MNRNAAEAQASPPRLLKVSDAAHQLQLSAEAVRILILSGELPATNVGGTGRGARYRIAQPDLNDFLLSRRTAAA